MDLSLAGNTVVVYRPKLNRQIAFLRIVPPHGSTGKSGERDKAVESASHPSLALSCLALSADGLTVAAAQFVLPAAAQPGTGANASASGAAPTGCSVFLWRLPASLASATGAGPGAGAGEADGGTGAAGTTQQQAVALYPSAVLRASGVASAPALRRGVNALCFSPDGRWVLAAGQKADRALLVWAVPPGGDDATGAHTGGLHPNLGPSEASSSSAAAIAGSVHASLPQHHVPVMRPCASGRLSQRVRCMAFSPDGSVLVTGGEKHLKFWPFEPLLALHRPGSAAAAAAATVVLTSQPAILSEAGSDFETFVGVACIAPSAASPHGSGLISSSPGSVLVYALTSAGYLCSFDGASRTMRSYVSVKARQGAYALDVLHALGASAAAALPVSPRSPRSPGGGSAAAASAAPGKNRLNDVLLVACGEGIVRAFAASDLEFLGTLPLPPAVGAANVTVFDPLPAPHPSHVFPAALSVRASRGGRFVSVLYADASVFVWDISTLVGLPSPVGLASSSGSGGGILKYRSLCGHAGPVTASTLLPRPTPSAAAANAVGTGAFPEGTFATASSDCTVRLWNLNPKATYTRKPTPAAAMGRVDESTNTTASINMTSLDASACPSPQKQPQHSSVTQQQQQCADAVPRSLFMREMLRVLYLDAEPAMRTALHGLSTHAASPTGASSPSAILSASAWPAKSVLRPVLGVRDGAEAAVDAGLDNGGAQPSTVSTASAPAIRALSAHPDGRRVAVGDSVGNVAIFDASTGNVTGYEVAHDGEVSAVGFAPVSGRLLVSASRDKLIHVFDEPSTTRRYAVCATLDEHKADISAVAFSRDESLLASGSADGSLCFFKVGMDGADAAGAERPQVKKLRSVQAGKMVLTTLALDPSGKNLLSGGSGGQIKVWNVKLGRALRTMQVQERFGAPAAGTTGSDPAPGLTVTKVVMDSSGLFVAAAFSDLTVRLFDFFSGSCLACTAGHAGEITSLVFSSDCRRLISTSTDGCIFVWKLGIDIAKAIHARSREMESKGAIGPNGASASAAFVSTLHLGRMQADTTSQSLQLLDASAVSSAANTSSVMLANSILDASAMPSPTKPLARPALTDDSLPAAAVDTTANASLVSLGVLHVSNRSLGEATGATPINARAPHHVAAHVLPPPLPGAGQAGIPAPKTTPGSPTRSSADSAAAGGEPVPASTETPDEFVARIRARSRSATRGMYKHAPPSPVGHDHTVAHGTAGHPHSGAGTQPPSEATIASAVDIPSLPRPTEALLSPTKASDRQISVLGSPGAGGAAAVAARTGRSGDEIFASQDLSSALSALEASAALSSTSAAPILDVTASDSIPMEFRQSILPAWAASSTGSAAVGETSAQAPPAAPTLGAGARGRNRWAHVAPSHSASLGLTAAVAPAVSSTAGYGMRPAIPEEGHAEEEDEAEDEEDEELGAGNDPDAIVPLLAAFPRPLEQIPVTRESFSIMPAGSSAAAPSSGLPAPKLSSGEAVLAPTATDAAATAAPSVMRQSLTLGFLSRPKPVLGSLPVLPFPTALPLPGAGGSLLAGISASTSAGIAPFQASSTVPSLSTAGASRLADAAAAKLRSASRLSTTVASSPSNTDGSPAAGVNSSQSSASLSHELSVDDILNETDDLQKLLEDARKAAQAAINAPPLSPLSAGTTLMLSATASSNPAPSPTVIEEPATNLAQSAGAVSTSVREMIALVQSQQPTSAAPVLSVELQATLRQAMADIQALLDAAVAQ
jgi:WD40 repeat protein